MPVLKGSFQTVYALFINRLYEQRYKLYYEQTFTNKFFLDLDMSCFVGYGIIYSQNKNRI